MDFNDYRDIFYFFQYQFYIRGSLHREEVECAELASDECKDAFSWLLDPTAFPVFNFLRILAESAGMVHDAWETGTRQGPRPAITTEIKRPPRGMRKAEAVEAEGRLPRAPKHFPAMSCPYSSPHFPNDAHRYMILEIPKGHRKNQIGSMYKSLLVHDAVAYGSNKVDIAAAFRKERLSELIAMRNLSLCEFIPGILPFRYPAETIILTDLFGASLFSVTEKKANPDFYNSFINERMTAEIERYLSRAEVLIHLAEAGLFKEYPAHLK